MSSTIRTLADLQVRLGDVPLDRIRFHPFPGTATVQDVVDLQNREGTLCELIEGVLLQKAVGYNESILAVFQGDTLDGGRVLPGFALPLQHLFAELDRHG